MEAERARLIGEIEGLRKAAESRVAEGEVNQMQEKAKSLRELLGSNSKDAIPAGNVPKSGVSPDSS